MAIDTKVCTVAAYHIKTRLDLRYAIITTPSSIAPCPRFVPLHRMLTVTFR
jgi:hypothetical protein